MKTRFLTRIMRPHSTLWVSLLLISNLAAQEPKETNPLPKPPFIAPMPERLQWTITIKSSAEEAKSTSADASHPPAVSPWALRRVDATKTGNCTHIFQTFQNGEKRENWYVSGMLLDLDSSKKNVMVVNYRGLQAEFSQGVGDPQQFVGWEAFSWLSLSKYKDYVNVGKEPCYHYVLDERLMGSTEAWISAQTKFPLVYRYNNQTYLFQYGPSPADLQLPPEYEKAWKRYQVMDARAQKLRNSGDR